jgi:ABC-type multidrug transport system ATPase subunit
LKTDFHPGITIQANDLAKRFNREWIFRKFNFTFAFGKTYAITGPNGSGKSTLLQILWGQSPQTSGTITYRSQNGVIPVEEIYKNISIATPYMDLVDEFTLEEQVKFHFSLKKIRQNLSPELVIEKMYLDNARKKQLGNFSSGMRQRVKLGLAFSTEADIVFLDEPGTNLDKLAFEWYLTALSEIQFSTLIFIASNNPQEYVSAHESIQILNYK